MTTIDWSDALCARIGSDLWFGDSEQDGERRAEVKKQQLAAAEYCHACPIKLPCLDFAARLESGVSVRQRHGIYGGTTPRERAENDPLITELEEDAA